MWAKILNEDHPDTGRAAAAPWARWAVRTFGEAARKSGGLWRYELAAARQLQRNLRR